MACIRLTALRNPRLPCRFWSPAFGTISPSSACPSSLALVAIKGNASTGSVAASLVGVAVLFGAVFLFALTLRSDRLARKVGSRLGAVASFVKSLLRKPPVADMGGIHVALSARRDWSAEATMGVAHACNRGEPRVSIPRALVTLRHVGVSSDEVGWAAVLAAFAFVRLISALPITPGGLGVVELGLTAALIAAGGDRAQAAASVLLSIEPSLICRPSQSARFSTFGGGEGLRLASQESPSIDRRARCSSTGRKNHHPRRAGCRADR